MIIQAVMVREFLVVFYGNELCMGMIMGVWLFSIALGALIFTAMSRKRNLEGFFPLCLLLFALIPLGEVPLIRSARLLLHVPQGLYISFGAMCLLAFLVIAPYGIVVGFSFPLGCHLMARHRKDGSAIASLYTLESLGSLLGGVLFSFALVERYSSLHILWALLCIAMLLLLAASVKRGPLSLGLMGAVLAGVFLFFPRVEALNMSLIKLRWESLISGLPLVSSIDSRYQNLALTVQEDQYSVYGNGQYCFSFPDPYGVRLTAHMILAEHEKPSSLLVIGETSGGFLAECLAHGVKSLHYVPLDSALSAMVGPYLDPYERSGFEDRKVTVISGDGRYYVNRAKNLYDVVILMLPDPSSAMLNRFYTREFFLSLNRIMDKRGVLALSLSSSPQYRDSLYSLYNASVYRTLREVFPSVEVSPQDTMYFFASDAPGVVTSDPAVLKKRFAGRHVPEERFSPLMFDDFFPPLRVREARAMLEEAPSLCNTDFRPVTYFYSLVIWDRISGSRMAGFLALCSRFSLSTFALVLALLILARILFVVKRKVDASSQQRFNYLASLAVFGFSAMGMEIVLLFSYQNLYGYLYQMVGLVVAAFMGGMALGAAFSRVALKDRAPLFFWVLQSALILFAAALPSILRGLGPLFLHAGTLLSSQALFFCLVVSMGVLNGMAFPLVGFMTLRGGASVPQAAGLVNTIDNLGAACGAFLCGTLFIPLMGVEETCRLMALMAFLGMFLWLPLLGRKR
ncbi:MAG: hypothetical protein RDV48_18410 [Candidatus Eremiobacteraeota bacterium]|nr:hypothetical protein [Candidatus Eremiobacteraeota bacterium]